MGCGEKKILAYVGTWPLTRQTPSNPLKSGIHVFDVDPENGDLHEIQYCESDKMTSMFCFSPDGHFLYATDEDRNTGGHFCAGGSVLSFAIDGDTGRLTHVNTRLSMGACPTYISIDHSGRYVFAANHGTKERLIRSKKQADGTFCVETISDEGSVAMFRVEADGSLSEAVDVVTFADVSTTPVPMAVGVHAHCVVADPANRYLLTCEKGGDRIYVHRIDHENGKLLPAPCPYYTTQTHAAPRHIVFHPTHPYFFVCNEVGGTVGSYRLDPDTGRITELDLKSAFGEGFDRYDGLNADIVVHGNGRFLYVSVRTGTLFFSNPKGTPPGAIAVFSIDPDSGELALIQRFDTLGENTRALSFDPASRFLYACSIKNDLVVRYSCDPDTGFLSAPRAVAQLTCPSSIHFLAL